MGTTTDSPSRRGPLHVVAGVLRRADGAVLLAQRPPGKDMAGKWELPGGKVHAGETLHAALVRELAEELGVTATASTPLIQLAHDYPDRRVVLYTREVTFRGEPVGREGQPLAWVAPARLPAVDLLEADAPIVTAISLPSRYLITPPALRESSALERLLTRAGRAGVELVQLRAPQATATELEALAACLAHRRAACRGALRWLIGGDPALSLPLAGRYGADGVHLPARFAREVPRAVAAGLALVAVSCHSREEVVTARRQGASFAVFGPVRATPSHPGNPGLGWERFAASVTDIPLPVYAIGGVGDDDVTVARAAGAQGVAGIRQVAVCA